MYYICLGCAGYMSLVSLYDLIMSIYLCCVCCKYKRNKINWTKIDKYYPPENVAYDSKLALYFRKKRAFSKVKDLQVQPATTIDPAPKENDDEE